MNKYVNKAINTIKEHQPEILVGVGLGGMVTSAIMAVRATPRALDLLEDKKDEVYSDNLTAKETIQAAWRPYVPAVTLGALSAACIIGGTISGSRRNAALASVYAISESTLKEYQRKTVEIVGEEKAREIEKEVVKARVKERPVIIDQNDSEYITNTGEGNTLFYDSLSGRYFRSSTNAVDRAINNINKSMLSEHYITVNEFYNELGIPTVGAGSLIGWVLEKEMADIRYDSDIDKNGNPYVVLEYKNRPVPLYNHYSNY